MTEEYAHRDSRGIGTLFRVFFTVIELWFAAMVLILGAAFVMGLLGANPDASFAAWVYARTEEIMKPFNGIFNPIAIAPGTEIRTSLLFAMLVYGAAGALVANIARRIG